MGKNQLTQREVNKKLLNHRMDQLTDNMVYQKLLLEREMLKELQIDLEWMEHCTPNKKATIAEYRSMIKSQKQLILDIESYREEKIINDD